MIGGLTALMQCTASKVPTFSTHDESTSNFFLPPQRGRLAEPPSQMPSNLLLTKIGTAILQLAARVGATGGSGFGVPSRKKESCGA